MVNPASLRYDGPMIDEALIVQLNAGDGCPPDAGPAWRAAHEEGIDMALTEDALRLTPWERRPQPDRDLALVRLVEQARARIHGISPQDS